MPNGAHDVRKVTSLLSKVGWPFLSVIFGAGVAYAAARADLSQARTDAEAARSKADQNATAIVGLRHEDDKLAGSLASLAETVREHVKVGAHGTAAQDIAANEKSISLLEQTLQAQGETANALREWIRKISDEQQKRGPAVWEGIAANKENISVILAKFTGVEEDVREIKQLIRELKR